MVRILTRTVRYVLLLCALVMALPGTAASQQPYGDLQVVRVTYNTKAELAELASRLDIWEVHHDQGFLVALVSSAEMMWLTEAGFPTHLHSESIQHEDTIPGFPCYRTIVEQYALLDTWRQHYPQLVQINTIGQSYEGRDLHVIRIANDHVDGIKPVFFLMANIHGRELITNETALDFVEYLLESYAQDADITWILDRHVIYVLVSANPDGHVKNEPGQPWTWWRKNTHPYGNCSELTYGVDLNRNAAFMWGDASLDPCNNLYQGPGPVSEPESSSLAEFVRSIFTDNRGTGLDDPAPSNTPGVFITLHSYSNLVLWPWSYTYAPAPNSSQLSMLGRKLASFNGYTALPAANLYPASGTTLDFVYGELGTASFLFEMGTAADGFYPDCSRYSNIVMPNIQALVYAARVARVPYETPFGPDIVNLALTPSVVTAGESVIIHGAVDDSKNGNQNIAGAEVSIDTPVWEASVTGVLTATDGSFNTSYEDVTGILTTGQLLPGKHIVYVQGMDQAGYRGPVYAAFLDVVSPDFSLEPSHAQAYAAPGSTVSYTLSVTNASLLTQTYWITRSAFQWETMFTPPPLNLGPENQHAVTLTVAVPLLEALPLNLTMDHVTLTVSTLVTPLISHSAYITTRLLRGSVYTPLLIRSD